MSDVNYNLFKNTYLLPDKLSDSEFKKLFLEFKFGSLSSKKKIVEHNLKLVIFIVNNVFSYWYSQNIVDKEDLISSGVVGLIKAIDSFDLDKKNQFSSYASMCISNEIKLFLRKFKHSANMLSLDQKIRIDSSENEDSLMYFIQDNKDYYDDILEKNEYELIDNIVDKLPDKYKKIVKMYFGFGMERMSQQKIADVLGLSQCYISRLLDKALEKITTELLRVEVINDSNFIVKKYR